MDPVAITGLLVAALRAEETTRADRLFEDPFAAALAGDDGREAMRKYRSASGLAIPIIEVRTRWYDEALARATADGIRQGVILAAGMDARAYRLAWPEGFTLFEVDQPAVIAHKARVLDAATPKCERVALGTNLAEDWPRALAEHGFDPSARTVWMVEGLLQYLDAALIERLFARIDACSAPGSVALYDVVGRTLLESPMLAPTLKMMSDLGAPWIFGSDDPATLLPAWKVVPTDPGEPGNAWKRWPFPVRPGSPSKSGFLVTATKP